MSKSEKLYMLVLKSDYFISHERLTWFINENHIQKENILSITQNGGMFTIFFYGYAETKEVTQGLFS